MNCKYDYTKMKIHSFMGRIQDNAAAHSSQKQMLSAKHLDTINTYIIANQQA